MKTVLIILGILQVAFDVLVVMALWPLVRIHTRGDDDGA